MQLIELARQVHEKKFDKSVRRMAQALDCGEMDVRRLIGLAPGAGRNQEKLWQIIVKLVPLCKEIGIQLWSSEELTAHDVEERMVGLLERLFVKQKPRPKAEFLDIAERAYARHHKAALPDVPAAAQVLPVEDTGKRVSTHARGSRSAGKRNRGKR